VSNPDTLWWDGFFHNDGTVRQFFFTEEVKRDVASIIMGEENTVPAFGFAFYKYKHDVRLREPVRRSLEYFNNPAKSFGSSLKNKGGLGGTKGTSCGGITKSHSQYEGGGFRIIQSP
jgi:hypothetical protein